eukprot:7014282-Pyramimonas_sp.AAC.1
MMRLKEKRKPLDVSDKVFMELRRVRSRRQFYQDRRTVYPMQPLTWRRQPDHVAEEHAVCW